MNKRTMVYAITLVWVAVLLQCVVTLGLKNDGKITEAFLSGESSPLTGTLTVKGELSNYLYSVTEKKELLSYLASSLNMTEYQEVIEEEAGQYRIMSKNQLASVNISLKERARDKKQVLVTTITLTDRMDSIIYYKEVLEKSYDALGLSCQSGISMKGSYEGKLSSERMNEIKDTMFRVLESRELKKQTLEDKTIYYGYTNRLDVYQRMNHKRVNTQLIFSFSQTDRRTYLNLAIPYYNEDF